MIKKILLLVAVAATSLAFGPAVQAEGIRIEIGDKPFYSHGPRYWEGDYEMTWVPGHMGEGHHWIHGHYVRGQHRRHDDKRNDHNDDHHNDDRH